MSYGDGIKYKGTKGRPEIPDALSCERFTTPGPLAATYRGKKKKKKKKKNL
jgi:hypothetical protein